MFTWKEKILLAVLACIQFNHIVDFMILMPLGPQLMRSFNIDPQQFGLLVSSYTLSAGLSGFFASLFIDRFDRKTCLQFFFLGFSIGTIACAFAPNYHSLLLTRSLTGIFGGVLSSLVLSIVSDAIDLQRRGTAMGVIMASFSVASIFGVPFSLYLANQFNWHAPFLFLGGLSLFVAVVIQLYLPSMREHITNKSAQTRGLQPLLVIFKNSNQRLALVFIFCLIFGHFAIIPFLSPSLVSNAGMTEGQLPLVYLVGGLFTIFSSPLIGRLSDFYGKKAIFAFSLIVSLLPIYFITHLNQNPVVLILALTASFFVIMGGRMIPAMAMVSSTSHPQNRGSFMSVVSSVQQLASAASSYVAGLMITKNQIGQLVHYDRVGYVAIVFSCLALILARRIRSIEGKL